MVPVTLLRAVDLWVWLAQGDGVAALPGAAAFIFTAILGISWLSRVRAARRLHAALDAYAERELDRERRRIGLQRVGGVSSRGDLPGKSTRGR